MEYTYNFGINKNYVSGINYRNLHDYFNIEKCKVFLETGTFEGNGVDWAVNQKHFNDIITIEIDNARVEFCTNKFKNNNNIKIIHDSSVNSLPDLIANIKNPTFIYLDAHFDEFYPILEESEILLNKFYNLDDLIVCIDDERLFTESLKQNTKELYKTKDFIDFYIDDSIVFCRKHWFKNNTD
jgi:hypothetical protein